MTQISTICKLFLELDQNAVKLFHGDTQILISSIGKSQLDMGKEQLDVGNE